MAKKTARKKLIDELDETAKTIAKVRDKYICQHCGTACSGSNCHGSHVVPVSSGHILRWDPINIKALCYHCHINWWHLNPTESGEWFKAKFPDRWKYLQERKHQTVKFKESDLEEKLKGLKEELSRLMVNR